MTNVYMKIKRASKCTVMNWVVLLPPKKEDMLKSKTPVSPNVTIFGNRVITDIISYVSMRSHWIRMGP